LSRATGCGRQWLLPGHSISCCLPDPESSMPGSLQS
jgi:hypothetical protein